LKFDGDANDKAALIAFLSAAYETLMAAATPLTPEDLEKEVQFWGGENTAHGILILTDAHVAHHRGQLTVYLRLKGVEPPRYVGW